MTEEAVEKKFDYEEWLVDLTKQSDVKAARLQVEQAVQAAGALPMVGVLGLLVGPGGLMNIGASQNLFTPDGLENVEMALLDAQRETMRLRKQMTAAPAPVDPGAKKADEPGPETPELARKGTRRSKNSKKVEAEKEQVPVEGS